MPDGAAAFRTHRVTNDIEESLVLLVVAVGMTGGIEPTRWALGHWPSSHRR